MASVILVCASFDFCLKQTSVKLASLFDSCNFTGIMRDLPMQIHYFCTVQDGYGFPQLAIPKPRLRRQRLKKRYSYRRLRAKLQIFDCSALSISARLFFSILTLPPLTQLLRPHSLVLSPHNCLPSTIVCHQESSYLSQTYPLLLSF